MALEILLERVEPVAENSFPRDSLHVGHLLHRVRTGLFPVVPEEVVPLRNEQVMDGYLVHEDRTPGPLDGRPCKSEGPMPPPCCALYLMGLIFCSFSLNRPYHGQILNPPAP